MGFPIGSYTWTAFIKMLAADGDPDAKLMLLIGGDFQSDAERRIQRDYAAGKIDRESYETRRQAFESVKARLAMPIKAFRERDRNDWHDLPNEHARRKIHLDGEG